MKQHITPDQLNELSDKGKERLREWWKPKDGDFYENGGHVEIVPDDWMKYGWRPWKGYIPLLSIGQMIEFLEEHGELFDVVKNFFDYGTTKATFEDVGLKEEADKLEICDALWEAVKEPLEDTK